VGAPDRPLLIVSGKEGDDAKKYQEAAVALAERTHGKTLAQATKNARSVLELLIESARRHGEPIPPPERKHSGNLRFRLPVSLHGRLSREAKREGVSLNQWIVSKLAG